MFSQRFHTLLSALWLAGCVTVAPVVRDEAPPPVDEAAETEARLLEEVRLLLHDTDEALWAHWTGGAPLDLAAVQAPYAELLSIRAFEQVKARPGPLRDWLGGALIASGFQEEAAAAAALEGTLSFPHEGREVPWTQLLPLLANEKSAVKRRALWAASLPAAQQLGEALAAREAARARVTEVLGLPSDFEATARGLNLPALRAQAEAFLSRTDDEWRATLARLSAHEVKLPVESLTRADLPRLLRVPHHVDAAFPADSLAARLATLPGAEALRIDVTASEQKLRLPLTVAPEPDDVRVSLKPAGGLREMQQALEEVGAALVLKGTLRPVSTGTVARSGAVYAALVRDEAWLETAGVEPRGEVAAMAGARWLFFTRLACAVVLATSREVYVEVFTRALGVPTTEEELVRYEVDTADRLRVATQLDAALHAAALAAPLLTSPRYAGGGNALPLPAQRGEGRGEGPATSQPSVSPEAE